MNEEIKKLMLKKSENYLVMALDDAIEIAEVYVADTASPVDDTVLQGMKLLKGLVIDAIDKIDGEDNI
jgi:hypothetical protein